MAPGDYPPGPETAGSSGLNLPEVRACLARLQEQRMVERIWQRDYTVWRDDPREIADRLGWLDAPATMRAEVPGLLDFAGQVRREGYRHIVLLGMGGSSLGPEVLRSALPPAPGFPQLIVLDSTVPAQVAAVAARIEPPRTLFLVSSKSGGTLETLSLYRYFRGQVESAGQPDAGRNFAAITDAGTALAQLGAETGFRRVFVNPADIGGRYSVLSLFGLVSSALAGLDIAKLLERAETMRGRCAAGRPPESNCGAWLGALLAGMAAAGRDKVTFITAPPIDSLGLWVEQLLAESLGKDGSGVIPIAGEPLLPPDGYGDDRLFVQLRVADGPQDSVTEEALSRLRQAGQPVARLELRDGYDLAAEFYRWEFATAVAGGLLGLHPFDQPDVQGSKDNTDGVLAQFHAAGRLPAPAPGGSLARLLEQAGPGDYLALLPYTAMSAEAEELLHEIRRRVMQRHRIATSMGYGPRYLHSTGQLHKGGPASGLYGQLTAEHRQELPIPGQRYGFGTLASAQAVGDFQALTNLGRRAVRIDLGSDPIAGLRRLRDEL